MTFNRAKSKQIQKFYGCTTKLVGVLNILQKNAGEDEIFVKQILIIK